MVFTLAGCAANQVYIGTVSDCSGKAVSSVEVEAWKNQWLPFYLPERTGAATTNAVGEFALETKQTVSFFVYGGAQLNVGSHPKYSESKCVESGT